MYARGKTFEDHNRWSVKKGDIEYYLSKRENREMDFQKFHGRDRERDSDLIVTESAAAASE